MPVSPLSKINSAIARAAVSFSSFVIAIPSTSLWPAVAGRRLAYGLLAFQPGQERLRPLVPYCPGSGQAVLNDALLYLDIVGKGYLQISCSTSLSWPFWPKYRLATALLCRRTLNQCSFDLVADLMPILLLPRSRSHPGVTQG